MDVKIKETIDKLKALTLDGDSRENLSAICSVLFKPNYGWTMGECKRLRDVFVGMLEQLDPEDWAYEDLDEVGLARLPKDMGGEPIHMGDELCGYGRPDGGVFCKATDGYMVFVGEIDDNSPNLWMTWSANQCRHYRRLTVEEILDELEGLRGTGGYEAVVTRAAELAGMLRELIDND